MNINLTGEQERLVEEEINSGRFRTVEEVVGEALQALRQKRHPSGEPANGIQRAAVQDMLAFVENNHVRLEGVSVSELLHEGRRL